MNSQFSTILKTESSIATLQIKKNSILVLIAQHSVNICRFNENIDIRQKLIISLMAGIVNCKINLTVRNFISI